MNERERMICARVKEFREQVKWSQADFSAQLGITLNQLASIEYGRTPLRYNIAWQLRIIFGVSLEWLSVGEFSPDLVGMDDLPPLDSTGLAESALLSEVSDKVHGEVPDVSYRKKRVRKAKIDKAEVSHRAFISMALAHKIDEWIARVPDGYTADFSDKLFNLGNTYLKALPTEPIDLVNARLDALMWERMRRELRQRVPAGSVVPKSCLTDKTTSDKTDGVKSEWFKLKKKIQAVTANAGSKSKLADFLCVDLTQLSKWLTDSDSAREPGADYTLRMQAWVNDPKRQK